MEESGKPIHLPNLSEIENLTEIEDIQLILKEVLSRDR